jgi:hypothetical protein
MLKQENKFPIPNETAKVAKAFSHMCPMDYSKRAGHWMREVFFILSFITIDRAFKPNKCYFLKWLSLPAFLICMSAGHLSFFYTAGTDQVQFGVRYAETAFKESSELVGDFGTN